MYRYQLSPMFLDLIFQEDLFSSFSLWIDENSKQFSLWISSYWLKKLYPYFLYMLEEYLHSCALRPKYSCVKHTFPGLSCTQEEFPRTCNFSFFAAPSFVWPSCQCWLPYQTMSNGCSSEETITLNQVHRNQWPRLTIQKNEVNTLINVMGFKTFSIHEVQCGLANTHARTSYVNFYFLVNLWP